MNKSKLDPKLMEEVNDILKKDIDPLYREVAMGIAPELANSKYMPWLLAHKMPVEGCHVLLALPDKNWKTGMGEYEVSDEFISQMEVEHGLNKEFVVKQMEESYFSGDLSFKKDIGPILATNRGLWVDAQSGNKWKERNGRAFYAILRFLQEQESTMFHDVDYKKRKEQGRPAAIGRIVPRYDSVKDHPDLLPGENYKEILRSKKKLSQNTCACRYRYPELNWSDMDMKVCFSADNLAEYLGKHDYGHEITFEDAWDFVQKAGKKTPHCHEVGFGMDLDEIGPVLCNCHTDACSIMRHTKETGGKYKMWDRLQKSRFRAVIDPHKCIDCGLCMNKRCMFDAIEVRYSKEVYKQLPEVDEVQCMGCGCCVETCPADAIKMVLVDPPEALYGYQLDECGNPIYRRKPIEKTQKEKEEIFNPIDSTL